MSFDKVGINKSASYSQNDMNNNNSNVNNNNSNVNNNNSANNNIQNNNQTPRVTNLASSSLSQLPVGTNPPTRPTSPINRPTSQDVNNNNSANNSQNNKPRRVTTLSQISFGKKPSSTSLTNSSTNSNSQISSDSNQPARSTSPTPTSPPSSPRIERFKTQISNLFKTKKDPKIKPYHSEPTTIGQKSSNISPKSIKECLSLDDLNSFFRGPTFNSTVENITSKSNDWLTEFSRQASVKFQSEVSEYLEKVKDLDQKADIGNIIKFKNEYVLKLYPLFIQVFEELIPTMDEHLKKLTQDLFNRATELAIAERSKLMKDPIEYAKFMIFRIICVRILIQFMLKNPDEKSVSLNDSQQNAKVLLIGAMINLFNFTLKEFPPELNSLFQIDNNNNNSNSN